MGGGVTDLVVFLVLVLVAWTVVAGITKVASGKVAVVERRGKVRRILTPGLHLLVPGLDRVTRSFDAGPQPLHLAAQPVIARDDRLLTAQVEGVWQVIDPAAAAQVPGDLTEELTRLVVDALRELVGDRPGVDVIQHQADLGPALTARVCEPAQRWGVTLSDLQVTLPI